MNYPSIDVKSVAGMVETMKEPVKEPGILSGILTALDDKNTRFSVVMDRLERTLDQVLAPDNDDMPATTPRESLSSRFENEAADLLSMYESRLFRLNNLLDRIRL